MVKIPLLAIESSRRDCASPRSRRRSYLTPIVIGRQFRRILKDSPICRFLLQKVGYFRGGLLEVGARHAVPPFA
jgi:hypothetical protein